MQHVLREWSSRIRFDDLEYAILSLGKAVTYKDYNDQRTTIEDLYYTGNQEVNTGVKEDAPVITKSIKKNFISISFRKDGLPSGFYIEKSLDGSYEVTGERHYNYMLGHAFYRRGGVQSKREFYTCSQSLRVFYSHVS
jgi:hypothetical protein